VGSAGVGDEEGLDEEEEDEADESNVADWNS
jgi:hypothetical protein